MADNLTLEDIDKEITGQVYTQDYSKKPVIDDVFFIDLKNYVGDDGDLCEILRITDSGGIEQLPTFKIAQINRSRLLPEKIKAWHLHLKQDEFWYVSPTQQVFVGLWDVRKKSKTKNLTMRINLGGGDSKLVFVPRGVAHGYANFSGAPIDLYYFVNKRFDEDHPDEQRISWDKLGKDFWSPQRD